MKDLVFGMMIVGSLTGGMNTICEQACARMEACGGMCEINTSLTEERCPEEYHEWAECVLEKDCNDNMECQALMP